MYYDKNKKYALIRVAFKSYVKCYEIYKTDDKTLGWEFLQEYPVENDMVNDQCVRIILELINQGYEIIIEK